MCSTKFQAYSDGLKTLLASFFFRRLGHISSQDECILFLESLEVLAVSEVLALGVGNSKSNRLATRFCRTELTSWKMDWWRMDYQPLVQRKTKLEKAAQRETGPGTQQRDSERK